MAGAITVSGRGAAQEETKSPAPKAVKKKAADPKANEAQKAKPKPAAAAGVSREDGRPSGRRTQARRRAQARWRAQVRRQPARHGRAAQAKPARRGGPARRALRFGHHAGPRHRHLARRRQAPARGHRGCCRRPADRSPQPARRPFRARRPQARRLVHVPWRIWHGLRDSRLPRCQPRLARSRSADAARRGAALPLQRQFARCEGLLRLRRATDGHRPCRARRRAHDG